ncbi:DUF5017 domain-containing protein [Niabella sp. CC-SYL272]|uniref:DUF5017 domain-containing protein n=1 Tax=Niabella agricola TaxID=2891571 RepID=UPI001F41B9D7|nr:DUF5017 domain-containing protein [Niabella agricola]MCF3108748.1 DUF5017 domain-containing protein [Niabella agricola]
MKIKNWIAMAGIVLVSCQKELAEVAVPDFDVTTTELTVKAGTPAVFKFSGAAAMVSFYPGEIYKDYQYKDGRIVDVAGKGLTLSFSNGVAAGNPAGTQANQFSILLSTDFSGNYADLASVKAATWVNITDSFALANSAAMVATRTVDLSRYVVAGKPVYFALRYINRPQVANGYARQWIIENFLLKSIGAVVNGTVVTIADQALAGFRIVDENPVNAKARSTITNTRVTLYGPIYKNPTDPIYDPNNPVFDPKNPIYDPKSPQYNPGAVLPVYVPYDPNSPYNDPYSENWAVSAPVTLSTVELGKDWSIPVRTSIYGAMPTAYSYTYNTPGRYEAVFVAANNTIEEAETVVKKIAVNVMP